MVTCIRRSEKLKQTNQRIDSLFRSAILTTNRMAIGLTIARDRNGKKTFAEFFTIVDTHKKKSANTEISI